MDFHGSYGGSALKYFVNVLSTGFELVTNKKLDHLCIDSTH